MTPTAARVTIAKAYARPGVVVMPATRMVPAIAAPSEEPRLDTLRDRPEISPCLSSGKLDWTTLTEGVSIPPSPRPISSRPGAKAHAALGAGHQEEQDADADDGHDEADQDEGPLGEPLGEPFGGE